MKTTEIENVEIPDELKEIWRIIANMEFNVIELKFALSWVEEYPGHFGTVEEFCHGVKSIEEIRSKIEGLENRVRELEIEADRLRLEFAEERMSTSKAYPSADKVSSVG